MPNNHLIARAYVSILMQLRMMRSCAREHFFVHVVLFECTDKVKDMKQRMLASTPTACLAESQLRHVSLQTPDPQP